MAPSSLDSVFGPNLSPGATFLEREAYRSDSGLSGPVDRWLTANIRSNRVAFLKEYLMLIDVYGADCVNCVVHSVRSEVSSCFA